jgi:Leucine-rich repeat (LRR) protein
LTNDQLLATLERLSALYKTKQLLQVQQVCLDENRLCEVSAAMLSYFPNLLFLWLQSNQIASLPNCLFAQTALKQLYLRDNDLVMVNPRISRLAALDSLDLSCNRRLPKRYQR